MNRVGRERKNERGVNIDKGVSGTEQSIPEKRVGKMGLVVGEKLPEKGRKEWVLGVRD